MAKLCGFAAAAALLGAAAARADTVSSGEAGLAYAAVYQNQPFLDCDDDVARRAVGEVRSTYRSAGTTVTGRLTGIGRAQDGDQVAPEHALGEVGTVIRRGRHSLRLGVGSGYDDQHAVLCFASIEDRLRREQAIREGREVAGTKTHTQNAGAGYTYEAGSDKLLLDYTARSDEGDQRRDVQDLSLVLEHLLAAETILRLGAGEGTETVTLAPTLNITHVMAGLQHRLAARWQVTAEATGERRSSLEEGHTGALGAVYAVDSQTSARGRLERDLWVQSLRATQTIGEASVVRATPTVLTTVSARRTQVDDPAHSAGNRYEVAVADTWIPRHKVGLKVAYGTNEVALVHGETAAEITYAIALVDAPVPVTGPGNLYAGYAVSQVTDTQDRASAVRTVTAGVLFAF